MFTTAWMFQIFFKRFCTISDGKVEDKPHSPCIILGKKKDGELLKDLYEVLYLDLGSSVLVALWSILWASVLLVNSHDRVEVKIVGVVFCAYPIISNTLDWFLVWRKVKKSFND